MTLVLQGELLGRLPRSLPHALQLGHRGADFQLKLVIFFIILHVTVISDHHIDDQEYCDMGLDDNGCWLGNYCMSIESGGCPSTTGAVTEKDKHRQQALIGH